MEAVAYVAGEPWTDRPRCCCPVIAMFCRSWNDQLDDAARNQLLRPLIPKLVGTRLTPEVELRRSYLAFDWLVRVHTAAWLELAGLTSEAAKLRALDELNDKASVERARVALDTVRTEACTATDVGDAAWDAAWDAAGDAARNAARNAAWDAWATAVRVAARDAVRVASGDAERPSVRDAAWGAWATAVRVAVRDAAQVRFSPTVEALQLSAVELIERMIAWRD